MEPFCYVLIILGAVNLTRAIMKLIGKLEGEA